MAVVNMMMTVTMMKMVMVTMVMEMMMIMVVTMVMMLMLIMTMPMIMMMTMPRSVTLATMSNRVSHRGSGCCSASLHAFGRRGIVPVWMQALKAITLSKEHKAIHAAERMRIEKAGGSVHQGRLSGRLEVSRSFGDAAFKRVGASATPNVISFELGARDEFMLVACDGFWNLWSADDAVGTAAGLLEERGGEDGGLKAVTNRLLNITVRERRCKDNCTVMLLRFSRR